MLRPVLNSYLFHYSRTMHNKKTLNIAAILIYHDYIQSLLSYYIRTLRNVYFLKMILKIIFLNLNAQLKYGIPQGQSSLSTLINHVSDQPSLTDHVWSDDPSGSSLNAL